MDTALTGRLLVATHDLVDPSFRHAVVLVLAHEPDEGAAGVVLNRPSRVALPERLDAWLPLASSPPVMFHGGPVGRDTVIAVGVARQGCTPNWRPLHDRVGMVDLGCDAVLARAELAGIRLFAGYAGWQAGQLEDEVASGAWFTVAPSPQDVLTSAPDDLWRAVLARQGGLFTTVPVDPMLN